MHQGWFILLSPLRGEIPCLGRSVIQLSPWEPLFKGAMVPSSWVAKNAVAVREKRGSEARRMVLCAMLVHCTQCLVDRLLTAHSDGEGVNLRNGDNSPLLS